MNTIQHITELELSNLNMNGAIRDIKCNRCKCYRKKMDYYNLYGRQLKTCIYCRKLCNVNQKRYMENKKQIISLTIPSN